MEALTDNDISSYGYAGYYHYERGEFYADPHAPYFFQEYESDRFFVCYQEEDNAQFGPFSTEEEAAEFTAILNKNYVNREHVDDAKGYSCKICGDITAKGMEREEEEMRRIYQQQDDEAAQLG
jgi:hypothetical protein